MLRSDKSSITEDGRQSIVARPLGTQQGIDFDKVEQKLISPALRRLGITNAITIAMGQHQSVPMAFFQQFLAAPLIIADVSIHNAALLHHLQIRETLQDRLTFLLCAKHSDQATSLLVKRGFLYDESNLDRSIDKLVADLYRKTDSLESHQFKFSLLTECQADVPIAFRQYVERALVARQPGDLEFLANEIRGTFWENEGMRLIGCAELAIQSILPKRVLLYMDQTGSNKTSSTKYASPKIEEITKRIQNAVEDELSQWGGAAFAIAGCNSIEEIIFHDICIAAGVPTTLYLPLPKEKFVAVSPQSENKEWLDRFNRLESQQPCRILAYTEAPPAWLQNRSNYSLLQRSYYWMLHNGLVNGGENLTLIVSMPGIEQQNIWSYADVIDKARQDGAKIVIVDTENTLSIHKENYRYYSSV